MRSKKGLELSLNIIVILVFSILVLGFGINFMGQIFGWGNRIVDNLEPNVQQEIGRLQREGQEFVVYPQTKTIPKGGAEAIGIGLQNPGSAKMYSLSVKPGYAVNMNGQEIQSSLPQDSLHLARESIELGTKETAVTLLSINVPRGILSGIYEVTVSDGTTAKKVYITVP